MKVNDDLYVLPITYGAPGRTMVMNLSLIVDPEDGATLVDTGMPGVEGAIAEAMAGHGLSLSDIRRVIMTHQDVDHIGSLGAIKAATGAMILAHPNEAPYIDGQKKLLKYPSEERMKENPHFKKVFEGLQYVPVDKLVEDGDRLDTAGGVRVIFTPGHSPGHICLYLERSKALIAGDSTTSEDGKINGPAPGATPDMDLAMDSLRKMAELDEISAIVAYHGGLVTADPLGQLRRIATKPVDS